MSNAFPIRINDHAIRNTEALYQACRFPASPEIQQHVIKQNGGYGSKLASKPHREAHTRADWMNIRVALMDYVIRVKLAQNFESFGGLLASTGTSAIVEQSRRDDFWGAKVDKDNANILRGQNVLGKLLMTLREEYLNACSESRVSLRYVLPLAIDDFLLFGEPIRAIGEQPQEP